MTTRRLIDADISARADAKVLKWDAASGTHVYVSNAGASGVPSGSSFPGSPSTNDLFFHATYKQLFYYDGTRWLSATLFEKQAWTTAAITAQTDYFAGLIGVSAGIWAVDIGWSYQVASTHNGTNFWTLSVFDTTGVGGGVLTSDKATVGSFVTPAPTAIGATMPGGASRGIIFRAAKTLSPGGLNFGAFLRYRIIGT